MAIGIDENDKNKISVVTGNGLGIEDGKVVAKAGTNVTIDENGINAKDTTLVGGEITPTTSEDGYENTYEIKDTDENKAILKDVASATKLSSVDSKVGDTNYSSNNYINDGDSLTEAASDLDTAIKTTANKVDAGWKATAGETSIDVKPTEDGVVPTLNFAGDNNISVTADKASSTINVKLDPTLEVESVTATGSVNAGGTTISSTGLAVGGKTYVSSNGINAQGQKITNVANGTDKNDAVNYGQLESYVSGNATYTEGDGININNKVISVDTGKGLGIEDGKVVAKAGTNVTIDENGINAKDTTLVGGEITPTTSEDGYENTYEIKDTDENKAILKDVASATKLSSVDSKVGDTNYSSNNYINDGDSLTEAASDLDTAIKTTANKVDAGWKATAGETSIDVKPTEDGVVPTLNFAGDNNISVTADKASSTINVKLDPTLEVESVTATGSVNAGGTTISSTGLAVGGKTYVSSNGINAQGQKITNVANGTDKNDAVNYGQLESYVSGNATYTEGDGININNKVISVDTGKGLGIEDGKVVAKAGTNVTIDENGINAKDTTLVGGEITPTTSEDGYENTYEIKDTDENKAILKDVASATKLSSVDSKVGDTNYSSNNYINDGDSLTEAASDLDTAIKTTANKVDAGWKATAGETSIDVKPTEDGVVPTLNFAGDNNINVTADKASSTINVKLDPTLEVESVTATGSVNAGGTTISSTGLAVGGKTYVSSNGINAQGQKITNVANGTDKNDAVNYGQLESYVSGNATYTEGDGININNKVISVDTGKGLGIEDGKVVAKAGTNVTIDENGINAKDTTLVGGEITPTTSEDGYENTYEIKDTDENKAILKDVASATKLSSVDSKVGDTNYSSNNYINDGDSLTVAAGDLDTAIKATADKVDAGWSLYSNGKEVKNVKPGNNWISIDSGDNVSITKNEDGNGIKISADLKDLDVEDTNAVLYDNEGKTSVTLGGTGHEAVKLTNVAAGALTETSTDAVNGSQLFETNTKVDAGWSLYSNGKEVKNVKPGNNWISIDSGDNVSITKNEDGNGIKISADLKDLDVEDTNAVLYDDEGKTTVTLGGEGHEAVKLINVAAGTVDATSTDAINGSQLYKVQQQAGKHTEITVNGGVAAPDDGTYTHDEQGHLDGNLLLKQSEGTNGQTVYDLKLNPDITLQSEDDKLETQDNRVELSGSNGTIMATTDFNDMSATTTINGGNVYVGNSVSVGDKVVMTNEDITGLSNTNWDGTTDNVSRAATEGQLKTVSDNVNAGWIATDNNGNQITVNPTDNTLNFSSDENVTVAANKDTGSIDVSLNNDIVLNGEGEAEDTKNNRVTLSGTNGTIMATTDFNDMSATTTINGGNVYAGSSVSVGDKVVITDKDITGLSNTTWDGTTDNVSRAATEGQLKTVSDNVNAGWIATDNNGNQITVNPTDNTLNFSGDENVTVAANKDTGSIDVSLNNDIVLNGEGEAEDTKNNRVTLSGTNGTIMATTDFNDMSATTTINGGNVYAGSSVSVGDKVVITDKDITGLSNTTWDGTTDDVSRAATEGQLKAVSDNVNAGWIATDNNGNQITVNPDDNTLNFSGDENVTVAANKDTGSIDVSLNNDIVLNGEGEAEDTKNNRVTLSGTNGTIMATTDFNDMSATTTINGGNVYAGSSVSVGDKVVITDKDITGLSNTTWDGTTDNVSRAATEGQLKTVSDNVNAGWIATDNNGNQITVNPTDNTLNFSGDENVTVAANKDTGSIDVSLNNDIVLNGEGEAEDTKNNRVTLSGTNGTIMATTDFNDMSATTTINGGNVYAGSSVSVGDKVVITDKDITGLSNTTWDGTTDDVSRAATEGQLKAVSDNVNAGWIATDNNGNQITVNPDDNTLNFSGDENVTVAANKDTGSIDVSLNNDIVLNGEGEAEDTKNNRVTLSGTNGTIMATTDFNDMSATTTINGGNVYAGSSVSVGDKVVITDKDITGLSNTTWDGTTDNVSRAATEGQLKTVSDNVNAGWIATDNNGNQITVNPTDNTLNFSGDENVTVAANKDTGSIDVSLNNDIVLNGEGEAEDTKNNRVTLSGTNGTIMATTDFNDMSATTTINGGNVYAGSSVSVGDKVVITDKDITGLSNTTWDGSTNDISRAATEGQLQMVSDKVTAGWTATDDAGNKINVNPETRPTLNFASGKNITVSANEDSGEVEVSLNDNINLNNRVYINGDPEEGNNTIVDIKSSDTSKEESIFAVEDKGNGSISIGGIDITNVDGPYLAVGDGKLKFYKDGGLSTGNATGTFSVRPDGDLEINGKNSSFNVDAETGNVNAINNSGSAIMMNDDSVALNASGNGVAISDEGITLNTNGSAVTVDRFNGATFTNTNTTESTNINGANITAGEGENQIKINGAPKADDPALSVGTDKFVVGQDGSLSVSDKFNVDAETGNINAVNSNGSAIMMNDDSVALNASGNGVAISNEGITLNANGSAVTVDRFNGATFTNTNTGETTNINGDIITTDTVKGLSNTTWDDELATQVANSEELQGTAATQGQLQQAVSAVATEAAKQHTTVSGDDNLTVKSSVNENGGTNYQVTLDDDITLGNPKAGNTEGERSFTINTTAPEGYVPDSYKEENSSGAEFIKENGGFMLFATDTQGHGIFGVTAKGSAWAKDFKTYTTDIYGNNTQYSLNDVGDAVAQMSSYYNKENGKSYTVFSRYHNEAEKDNPFETVDGATRDIPLALRDDGAVLIGATIEGEGFTDNGIRINAEIDDDGNNKATITGLENTEWKPPTPVATLAANDGSATVTSRAATESQLNDLYSAVAAYDVNVDGTIDYSHIALAGAPYGASRAGNGTPTGGTSITNVAYASGTDGSEAVNVDYLKDTINKAVEAGGSISNSDKHLVANTAEGSNGVYKPNAEGNVNLIVSDEKGNSSTVTIGDVASKTELDSLKTNVGDLNYDKVTGDKLINGDSVTTAIGKLDNKIENISGTATDAANNTVTGGTIKDDGTISLTQKDGGTVALDGKLTDSGVVQDGTKFDGETGTLTITSQDKYNKGTSSVTVSGIASKNDIGTVKDTIGATSKEDLKDAYKDADKDGNATTEYITDSETMVDADVALDHAVQDVANTSYANDMILSNRIDNVESRLGDVEERIDKVGAMAAAIANLRTMGYDPEAPTEVAVGVGQYKSETGIALGIFHYPNQDFMLSASISTSGDEVMGGIGATWRIGRKTAEEKAKDEEERILAKAEEIKQAAKRAEVKEQAERHAKLLAEREAKGEPIVPVEESAEQAQA
ncbi:PAS domain S-box protein [Megamonas hypermegale]|uniref:PAS domain S-box protein n=5 Tax=Megamonas hypermegale TaxID=158847 RepID=A0A239TBA2_9FIRM|nr:YadA-like family protein [Megamonas hypermegale]SNU94995.1 PAS domain S-box protein [Megamonas hypermegale]